jgi:uroporphyrinogen-III synthase
MKTPIFGLRVLNTRPLGQNKSLTDMIKNAGGTSIELPAISILEVDSDWHLSMPDLATIHHAIFVSKNAADYFFTRLKQQKINWNYNIQITAIGKTTAATVASYGMLVNYIPLEADSEHLLELKIFSSIAEKAVLLIKGKGGRPEIANALRQRGATLITLDVYQRKIPQHKKQDIEAIWQDDKVDIILFTSEEAIRNIFTLFGAKARPWLCKKPCLVISKRIANAAALHGVNTIIQSSFEKILNSLFAFQQGLAHDEA